MLRGYKQRPLAHVLVVSWLLGARRATHFDRIIIVCLPIPDVLPRAGGIDEIEAQFATDTASAEKLKTETGEVVEVKKVRERVSDSTICLI